MRHFIAAALVAGALATNSVAEEGDTGTKDDTLQEFRATVMCNIYTKLAKTVMTARQKRRPFFEVMGAMSSLDDLETPGVRQMGERLVEAAYEYPAFSSPELSTEIISDFTNDFSLRCYKALREGRMP